MPADSQPVLSVIIPAFNEAARIGPTLDRLGEYLVRLPYPSEILVVDDGSGDGTAEVVRDRDRREPPCRVLRNGRNRGKGFSVRRGAREAAGRLLVVSDADLSTPIEELERLLPFVERGGYSIAIGSRALPDSRIEVRQNRIREGMGKVFNGIIRALTGIPFRDTQCGFKLMARREVLPLLADCRVDRFCYDVELIYLALRRGLKVVEVPVRWRNSVPSRVRILRDSGRMLVDAVRIVLLHGGRGRGREKVTGPRGKVVDRESAAAAAEGARKEGKRVVFTNGCFDLIHAGHVHCLEAARRAGDFLIVGINSDRSVRKLKGEGRPIFPQEERAELLAGMGAVDLVFVFDEETPLESILRIRPDRIVKGADWEAENVVGREQVESWGGKVVLVPRRSGASTTSLLETVRKRFRGR